jgi:hypothetical protein
VVAAVRFDLIKTDKRKMMKTLALIVFLLGAMCCVYSVCAASPASVSDDFNRSGIGYSSNGAAALVSATWTNGGNQNAEWAISSQRVITRTRFGSGNALLVNTALQLSGNGEGFTLSADLTPLIAANWAGVVWGYQNSTNYYFLQMKAGTNSVWVYKVVNGTATALGNSAAASSNFAVGGTNTVTINSSSAYNFNVTITDKGTGTTLLSISRTDTGSSLRGGYAGLILATPGTDSRFAFDNFGLQVFSTRKLQLIMLR